MLYARCGEPLRSMCNYLRRHFSLIRWWLYALSSARFGARKHAKGVPRSALDASASWLSSSLSVFLPIPAWQSARHGGSGAMAGLTCQDGDGRSACGWVQGAYAARQGAFSTKTAV